LLLQARLNCPKTPTDLTRNQTSRKFLGDISESLVILSSIQAVTLPGHFSIGLDTVANLAHHIERHQPHLHFDAFFPFWTLPNLDLTVVSNRETPEHFSQDIKPWSYLLTATFGSFDSSRVSCPGLRAHFPNAPGTVMVGLGRMVSHSVARGEGDHVSITAYTSSSFLKVNKSLIPSEPISITAWDENFIDITHQPVHENVQ
jgi:hypothetical protein